jgi:hypothetical protein
VIALMMEAVNTSETSANFYQTARRNIPQDSRLHARRRENLNLANFREKSARYIRIILWFALQCDV